MRPKGVWQIITAVVATVAAFLLVTFLLEKLFQATGGLAWSLAARGLGHLDKSRP